MIHYSAAKAAVLSPTNNLAFNWARHNMCENAIIPGLITTPAGVALGVAPPGLAAVGKQVPHLQLALELKHVAELCCYLASYTVYSLHHNWRSHTN